jgi:hypothetical protein
VDGDKLTKEIQLSCYNQARLALLEGARGLYKENPAEITSLLGGHSIVEQIVWVPNGNYMSVATRPIGLVKFEGMLSRNNRSIILRPQNDLQKVLRGDSFYAQSTDVAYIFDQGTQYVHYGDYILASYPKNVTGATNASPIVLTCIGHGLASGDIVLIENVGGNTAANGEWTVTVIDADHISLDGSTGNSWSYTSGGTVSPYCRIIYKGITDWELSDITSGTAEETIRPAQIPDLVQLAIAIAKGAGGAQAATLAAQLLGGK